MSPRFIDVHAHIQFFAYDEDREKTIQRALGDGVWMINSGSNLTNSEDALKIAEEHEQGVYATVGIHPSEVIEGFNKEKMRLLALHPKCVAIGECGLEYFSDTTNQKLQEKLFIQHIDIAYTTKKPLIIHCRDAYDDLYKVLKTNQNKLITKRPALMHFFSGTQSDALKFLELGCVFSFGGAVTFDVKSGKTNFASIIKSLPIEAILLETDCPYVSPVPFRGKRNEPAYLVYVAEKIAEIKGLPVSTVAEITTENAIRFFAINKINC